MDFHQSVKNSVANIQDELTKISVLASFSGNTQPDSGDDFKARVLSEFNAKLRKMRAEITCLEEKNSFLAGKVKVLESELRVFREKAEHKSTKARPFKSDGEIKLEHASGPRESMTHFRPDYEISSSPLKPVSKNNNNNNERISPVKYTGLLTETRDKMDLTSSQFNKLATQYSDASSQPDSALNRLEDGLGAVSARRNSTSIAHSITRSPQRRASSPLKKVSAKRIKLPQSGIRGSFASDDESDGGKMDDNILFVADSQDEFEPIGNPHGSPSKLSKIDDIQQTMAPPKPKYPSHYTALQRVEFLRNYYRPKITQKNYKVDFSKNPITEKNWSLEDFVPNQRWKPPKKLNQNLGVMTKAQEMVYDEFFAKAGLGRKAEGPAWDSDDESKHEDKDETWVRSQVMDKYSSPPGYMIGDFVSTQDQQERKRAKNMKEQERIKRRFESAITGGEFVFYEPVFNDFARAKKYVGGPFQSKKN